MKINGSIHFKQLKNEYSNNNQPILHTSSSLITPTNTLVSIATSTVATSLVSPSSIKIFNETMNKEIESKNFNTIKSDSITDGSNPPYFNDELQTTNEQQIVLKKQSIMPVPSNSNSKNSNLYNNNNNEDQTTISSKLLNSGSNNNNNNDFNCNTTRLTTRSESNNSGRKEKASSVGYRLGKRKLLFEKRRRISDYALIFAMTGVLLMIIENEFSMANIYNKVS